MKVSLGMKLQTGAWGGGNQFGHSLSHYLQQKGVDLSYNLTDPALDIILLAEPDASLKISAYSHRDILKYLLRRNRQAIVVHRINNTSEARDDAAKTFNKFRIHANKIADHTIFVSQWVHDRYVESGYQSPHYSTILNGGNAELWKPAATPAPRDGKLKIVTHHWSTNSNKGFAIYQQVDQLLADPVWQNRLEFTYIGRLPDGFRFENSRYLEPLSGEALANELRQHHIYLTASQNEAGPNHCLEGAMCGLPLLYIESGAMPEYGRGYGIGFTPDNFVSKLDEMLSSYDQWQPKMANYPFTSERMCEQYYTLFQALMDQRSEMLKRRTWWRQPQWLYQTWRYRPR